MKKETTRQGSKMDKIKRPEPSPWVNQNLHTLVPQ